MGVYIYASSDFAVFCATLILFTEYIHCNLDPVFHELLRLLNSNPSDRSDIYHGEEYKKFSRRGGFLCKETNPYNFSFINTDGVSLFKSSNSSVWPIFLIINEIPASAQVPLTKLCLLYYMLIVN